MKTQRSSEKKCMEIMHKNSMRTEFKPWKCKTNIQSDLELKPFKKHKVHGVSASLKKKGLNLVIKVNGGYFSQTLIINHEYIF